MSEEAKSSPEGHEFGGDNLIIPELESAIERNGASFNQLAWVMFGRGEDFNPNPVLRRTFDKYYIPILRAFESSHGGILKSYNCVSVRGALALTDRYKIHCALDIPKEKEFLSIEQSATECDRLRVESEELLRDGDRRIFSEELFALMSNYFALFDSLKMGAPDEFVEEKHSNLSSDLAHCRNRFIQIAQRNAQLQYFLGMAIGLGCMLPISTLVWATLYFLGVSNSVVKPAMLSWLAGATGAVVSVLSRMTFGNLALEYQAGTVTVRLLGAVRPVMGAIFGVFVWVVGMSELLPLKTPSSQSTGYFFPALAFVAGFSERWAQDMLVRIGRNAIVSPREKPESAVSAKGASEQEPTGQERK